ncbi:cytochrome b5 domain-containing protein [Clostridium oryzae]|uniref:Cytochrome b5-like heme/steroid binding domain protein n=1 Tax=Clostridium oryzae TaxID=1450648 RepID=A0A1V4IM84_9CLOT|nr:cytochrome b5 domain-containing protein [Clostridium oryzae]OPJ60979.1 cytochrome b5-like heme/steroid binding domain protein [Clostridium oryzae]
MSSKPKQKILDSNDRISIYIEKMVIEPCPYVRNYYGCLIKGEMTMLFNCMKPRKLENKELRQQLKEFTLEELKQYDGANGKPAYIAVDGVVYDVSLTPSWGGGTHFSIYAGRDVTREFNSCHQGQASILESIPKIGILKS